MNGRTSVSVALLVVLVGCGGSGGDPAPTQPPPPGSNHNPTVNLNIDKTSVSYGETAALSATTADVDGNQVTLSWSSGRGSVQSSGPTATTATYTAPNSWGPDSAVATASDGNGGAGRAAALVYVRYPNPPNFTLGATSSVNCGSGTPNPGGFVLTITSPENVLITNIAMKPSSCPNVTCRDIVNYSPMLQLTAGVPYTWSDGGCQTTQCCESSSCGNCGFWAITIWGQRPAPDGGSFVYECNSWTGPGDSCN